MHGGLIPRVVLVGGALLHDRRDNLLDQGLLSRSRLVRAYPRARSLARLRLVFVARHRMPPLCSDGTGSYGACRSRLAKSRLQCPPAVIEGDAQGELSRQHDWLRRPDCDSCTLRQALQLPRMRLKRLVHGDKAVA